MKITNVHNVPQPLVTLAEGKHYSKGKSDYSVTELMSPPRVQRLRALHDEHIVQDVAEMLWPLLGSALHVVMERGETEGWTSEERLFTEVDGVVISGAIDLQENTKEGVNIVDYKFTSAWAVMNEKIDWEQQLNVYKWLVETVKKKKVNSLRICAMIRDFNRHDIDREGYPQAPIHMVDIPMWDAVKAETYVRERLEMHRESKLSADFGEPLQKCSPEERWMSDTIYAVKRDGRKTAIRVFKDETEASVCADEESKKGKGKAYVEIRPAEPKRCTGNYCGVAKFCDQHQSEGEAK
jgi:hypothetical protein